MTPYEYFSLYWSKEIFEIFYEQSTLYAHQKDGIILNSSIEEMEQFIGILLFMGLVKMPAIKMYWAAETRFAAIADIMSRNRFEQLRKYLHVANNDNTTTANDPAHDKLFKIRPLLSVLRTNMQETPPEERHSVDEQMIPFKGRSNLKQYVKGKPHKWGFKVFMRAGESGMMYDFEIYTGKGTCEDFGLGFSGDIVMALTSELPEGKNFKLYFDNWFSSLQLAIALKERGIFCVGTIRSDRMGGCSLSSEAQLKLSGRGSYDWRVETEGNVALIRWYDRKAVNFVCTYSPVDPEGKCKRWSAADKKSIEIKCPNVVKEYNAFMGGVDLADMLIELYRVDIRSVKWYTRIIYWCLSVAVVNAWLLYRRHQQQKNLKFHFSLANFQSQIAAALLKAGQFKSKKRNSQETSSKAPKRKLFAVRPVDDVRYDGYQHWPEYSAKGRCKFCPNGFTQVTCTKCKINLCMTPAKNCFLNFHTK